MALVDFLTKPVSLTGKTYFYRLEGTKSGRRNTLAENSDKSYIEGVKRSESLKGWTNLTITKHEERY